MMKVVALLLALIAAITVNPSEAAVACFKHWTRGQGGKSGAQVFTGITLSTTTENYNNPLYYSLAAAKTGFTTSNAAKGRFSGKLPKTNYTGPMKFDFFAKGDQILITFTKGTSKGTMTGGKGCYLGIKGTATRKMLVETPVKVFEWTFCPSAAPKCKPL